MGHPSHKYFNNLIRSNLILKDLVTLEDANKIKKTNIPNIDALKENITRIKPDPVVTLELSVIVLFVPGYLRQTWGSLI